MENLKFIIKELNKILPDDYNCFTFNNLTTEELLQVILSVMQHLGILEKSEKRESALIEISKKLEALRYTDKHLDELRADLQEGKRDAIHPILMFLLKNQENVITRNYLSKYANQIEIPGSIKAVDGKIAFLEKHYTGLIDEFWQSYSSNKTEKSWALEAKVLEDDIWQMRLDMGNINKRLNLQKSKLQENEVGDKKIDFTKAFCEEEKRNLKLIKQLREEKRSLEDLDELHLFYLKRKNVDSLEDFLENVGMNKQNCSLIATLLEELKTDATLMKRVYEEEHPDLEEIENSQRNVYTLQILVKDLRLRAGETFTTDRVLRKKKDLISKQILKVQAKNDCLIGKIEEILSLLGGDVLSGKSLKEYVSNLRQTSLIYKDLKRKLCSLENELEILKKSLEVLCGLEKGVKVKLSNIKQCEKNELDKHNSSDELNENKDTSDKNKMIKAENSSEFKPITKFKFATKFNEFTTLKNDFLPFKNKHDDLHKTYSKLLNEFNENKMIFEEHAGDLIKETSVLDFEYQNLNEAIKAELNELNEYVEQAEYFKESLLRYSQYIIESTGNESYLDALEHNLKTLEEKNEMLSKEAEIQNVETEKIRFGIEAIKGVQQLVMTKFDSQM